MIHDPKELARIGNIIRSARAEHSQQWLAAKVGTTASVISNIEKGKRLVPKRSVSEFAKLLKLSEKDLLPTRVNNIEALRYEIKSLEAEAGIAFRDLRNLPTEAKEELVSYYKQLKNRYEKVGEVTVAKQQAEDVSAKVLQHCGMENRFPVDLLRIAKEHNIQIEESNTIDADGWIICPKDKKWAGVKYKKGLSLGKQRFTIAHELGHYFLGNLDSVESSCYTDGQNKDKNNSEREADAFAASLLMPEKKMIDEFDHKIRGINSVLQASQMFEVSQTAAALRLVKLADIPCAVINSVDRRIRWGYCSSSMYLRVKRGDKLARGTQAYKLAGAKGRNSASKPVPTAPEKWFYGRMPGRFIEDSASIYRDNVLTLVWVR